MKKTNLNKLLCASILSLCTVNVLFAQSTKTDFTQEVTSYEESAYGELKGYVATKSSTGSKMNVDIVEIPQSITVITNDMMTRRGDEAIQNITAYDASVTQPYGENTDQRTNYGKLRGLTSMYHSTFLDGMKLLYSDGSIPKNDPYALERVEILKGPSSVLYGASSPAGLLNLQSKKANSSESKEVGLSYSSYNNTSIFADINHKINEKVLVRLTGTYKEGDNELDKSTNKSYFFNPSLTYLISDDTTLDLYASVARNTVNGLGLTFNGAPSHYNLHNSVAAVYGSIYVAAAKAVNDLNLKNSYFIGLDDKEKSDKVQKSISSVLNSNITDNLKFHSGFRYMNIENDTFYSSLNGNGLTSYIGGGNLALLPMQYIEQTSSVDTFVLDNNFEYKWGNASIKNTSIFGIDIQHQKGEKSVDNADTYTFDISNSTINSYIQATGLSKKESSKTTQLAGYISNHMKIQDKFILSTSLRYDKVKNELTNELTNSTEKQTDGSLTNRIGVTYLSENGLSPYISYSTSFQNNLGKDFNGKVFVPSEGKQSELGIKFHSKNKKTFASLAYFDLEQKNALESDTANTGYSIQNSKHGIKGLELNIQTSPFENANLNLSFATLRGEYLESNNSDLDGKDLGELPNRNASIWFDYTFDNTRIGDLTLGSGVKYVGESLYYYTNYLAAGTPMTAYKVNSYTITDAVISTKYNNWNIAFNIYNLFDKEARIANTGITSSAIAERTFKLTASYKF